MYLIVDLDDQDVVLAGPLTLEELAPELVRILRAWDGSVGVIRQEP